MTEPALVRRPIREDEEVSLLTVGTVVVRHRRLILSLAVVGALLGFLTGLRSGRVYQSDATFIPETSDRSVSEIALAASQFGIRLPTGSSGSWGPQAYVEILRSRALLKSIVLDTLVVAEEGNRRVAVMDLLRVDAPTQARRIDLAVEALQSLVSATVVSTLGAVHVTVRTRWPSVSYGLAELLVRGVNRFNLETRKSRAV